MIESNIAARLAKFPLTNLLRPRSVGLEQMFDSLIDFADQSHDKNYPPYNLIKINDNLYQIEIAVAGLSKEDIEIEQKDGLLKIYKESQQNDNLDYIHRGISMRNFVHTFRITPDVKVMHAKMKDGLLSILLERDIPEEKKSKKIEITQ